MEQGKTRKNSQRLQRHEHFSKQHHTPQEDNHKMTEDRMRGGIPPSRSHRGLHRTRGLSIGSEGNIPVLRVSDTLRTLLGSRTTVFWTKIAAHNTKLAVRGARSRFRQQRAPFSPSTLGVCPLVSSIMWRYHPSLCLLPVLLYLSPYWIPDTVVVLGHNFPEQAEVDQRRVSKMTRLRRSRSKQETSLTEL